MRPTRALSRRISALNGARVRSDGAFVLYWMIAARRPYDNFGLERAVEWAIELDRPLVVLEALRVGYPWASDRLHDFVIDGMRDNERYFRRRCTYYPYLEPRPGAGTGLLLALSERAAVVVTDRFPAFFLPRMVDAAAPRLSVLLEAVDGAGILPLAVFDRSFSRASAFRRSWHFHFAESGWLEPAREPLAGVPDRVRAVVRLQDVERRFPPVAREALEAPGELIRSLPVDHGVSPTGTRGGFSRAEQALDDFVRASLARYGERGDPLNSPESRLSPYLHFGHISAARVLRSVADAEGWSPSSLRCDAAGKRQGFWGLSRGAEAFLDELCTWRELSYCWAGRTGDHHRYEAIPEWARRTLEEHRSDPRQHTYSLERLDAAETDDRIWNAAQRQLVRDGTIHGYLRMLWGKRVLEWSDHPADAHAILVELNNRYALDGRDPNSYSGIGWCFGLFDRPWGPKRPVFGTVRYMNSEGARRKFQLEDYLRHYAA